MTNRNLIKLFPVTVKFKIESKYCASFSSRSTKTKEYTRNNTFTF